MSCGFRKLCLENKIISVRKSDLSYVADDSIILWKLESLNWCS